MDFIIVSEIMVVVELKYKYVNLIEIKKVNRLDQNFHSNHEKTTSNEDNIL